MHSILSNISCNIIIVLFFVGLEAASEPSSLCDIIRLLDAINTHEENYQNPSYDIWFFMALLCCKTCLVWEQVKIMDTKFVGHFYVFMFCE